MKLLKNILLLILVLLVIGAIYLASLSGSYDVSRSRVIEAEPVVVFNDLNDYKNWADWGPWYESDSTIQVTYGENTIGAGAHYSWISKDGDGAMNTLKTEPPNRIDAEILFATPFGEMRSEVYWVIEPNEKGTNLTWGMKGEMPFLMRFMADGMDDQMGPMEERGLELFDDNLMRKLKIHRIENMGVVDYSGGFYLYQTASSRISDMNPKFTQMIESIQSHAKTRNINLTGSPFTIYHRFDPENDSAMFSVAIPVRERIMTEKGSNILTGYMKRGQYVKTVLYGNYTYLKLAWDEAMSYGDSLADFSIEEGGEPFEVYVNLPSNTPNPADLVTEIYIPVQR